MRHRSRAIVPGVKAPEPADLVVAGARVRSLVEEVIALDAEVEALTARLAAFEAAYVAATAEAFGELAAAERLTRRLERLRAEVARLVAELRRGPVRRELRRAPAVTPAPRRIVSSGEGGRADEAAPREDGVVVLDPGELDLKALHRRLARILHPDLARDDAQRARSGELMARVNDAYARGDRAALELLAERLGAGEAPGDLDDDARRAHLARRALALTEARDALAAERERLRRCAAHRLHEEAARLTEQGRDLASEAREAALGRAAATRARALSELDRLWADARELDAAHRAHAAAGGADHDPVAASLLVRRPAQREPAHLSPAARALARSLVAAAAAAEPWEAALTILAYLCELAGRHPDAVGTSDGIGERWDALRAGWRSAPEIGRALARLPRHVELGLRRAADGIVFGLQLADAAVSSGVHLALGDERVRALASRVLAVLGPRMTCAGCGDDVLAVHLLLVRGLDEVHGFACPRCAEVLRSFWRFGGVEGVEALAPLALEMGVLVEVELRLGGAELAFQLLPAQRERLTVADLDRRLRELVLAPHAVAAPRRGFVYRSGRSELARGARVPAGRIVTASVRRSPPGAARLARELRARIAARFR
jgi:hypothetical protein